MAASTQRVVIVGGGFGGLYCAIALRRAPVQLTLIDRRNFHLFQPLLYQVATGALSPADIASPLRKILKKQENARVLLAEARGFDVERRRVLLDEEVDGSRSIEYDTLVVAAGSHPHYFGNDRWPQFAPGLKTVEDATRMRRSILEAFERAERETSPEARRAWLTFVIIGGGPTGVELAGALAELARDTLRRDFRAIDPTHASIQLVEGESRLLHTFPPRISDWTRRTLERLGVHVRTGTRVVDMDAQSVTFRHEGGTERVPARTILWAAGVAASPLGAELARAAGAEIDKSGRVVVGQDFSVAGHPEVFVVGDLARYVAADGKPLPGVAPVAMQEGRHVAHVIEARIAGVSPKPFRYRDRGDLATVGRAAAVGRIWGRSFAGLLAWLLWLFVHLLYLVGFENRALVLFQWAYNYFTRNRSARLITQVPESETLGGGRNSPGAPSPATVSVAAGGSERVPNEPPRGST
jgi:NADH dehydrogenase